MCVLAAGFAVALVLADFRTGAIVDVGRVRVDGLQTAVVGFLREHRDDTEGLHTELTEVAAEMTTLDAGLAGTGSPLVETAKVFAASVPAPGFVSPLIVSDAAVEAGSEHDAPTRVIVTVCALAVAVALQLVKPEFSTIVGVAGTVNPELNATVIVLPVESAPLALDVSPTVQSERAEPV